MQRRCCARRGYGDVIEYDEERDGSWNVDIAVNFSCPNTLFRG